MTAIIYSHWWTPFVTYGVVALVVVLMVYLFRRHKILGAVATVVILLIFGLVLIPFHASSSNHVQHSGAIKP